jgi:hypothetical protein
MIFYPYENVSRSGAISSLCNGATLAYYSFTVKPRDPEEERSRLAELYASMTEGELRKIAENPKSLTQPAIAALNSEFARRALDIKSEIPQPEPVAHPEIPDLVILRHFRDFPEALLARGGLQSAGIETFFDDENIVRLDWFISNAVGGIKLLVRPEDVVAANEILQHGVPETFDVSGVGEYEQPRCPKCQSLDVISEIVKNVGEKDSAGSGGVVPGIQNSWKCESCGNAWPAPPGDPDNS